MKIILLKWLINALALWAATYFIKGIEITGPGSILLAAALLGILNSIIRPIILILTLPLNIITLGLFTLVINGAMLILVSYFIKGFIIHGFWPAVLGALVISLVSWVINWLIE